MFQSSLLKVVAAIDADNGTSLYGDENGIVYCYVGVSDEPAPECDISKVDRLVLTSVGEWPYYASCHVDRTDGRIEMLEVKKPNAWPW